MYVKILNSKVYKKECYLFSYGITSYGITPHMKKAINFFEDEKEEIIKCLKSQDFLHEFFGDINEREKKKKGKR